MVDENGNNASKEAAVREMATASRGGNYVSKQIIAQLFGVTVRRVEQLIQEGVISMVTVSENGHSVKKFDLIATVQKYIKYLSDKAYGKSRTEKEMELREKKMEADIALKESQGELHRLKTEIAAGKYIDIEEVKLDYSRFFVIFKKFAMAIPNRIAGRLTGRLEPLEVRAIEKELSTEIKNTLTSFVVAGVVEQTAAEKKKEPEADGEKTV